MFRGAKQIIPSAEINNFYLPVRIMHERISSNVSKGSVLCCVCKGRHAPRDYVYLAKAQVYTSVVPSIDM